MLEEHCIIRDMAYLKRQAERCRRLAAGIGDRRASELLEIMAREYAQLAEASEQQTIGHGSRRVEL
jgi:hypothetical protein